MNEFRAHTDEALSRVRWTDAMSDNVLSKTQGGIVVKRKFSAGLALVLALMVFSLSALAALMVNRTDESGAITAARQAIFEKYGLTPETLGMFIYQAEKEENAWVVHFWGPSQFPTGEYTVTVRGGRADASWTGDDEDGGALWGQEELEYALRHYDEVEMPEDVDRSSPHPTLPPTSVLEEDKGDLYESATNTAYFIAQPGEGYITHEEMLAIAYQALKEEFGLTEAELDGGDVVDDTFFLSEDGSSSRWIYFVYLVRGDVEMTAFVAMDGATGTVCDTALTTGGVG